MIEWECTRCWERRVPNGGYCQCGCPEFGLIFEGVPMSSSVVATKPKPAKAKPKASSIDPERAEFLQHFEGNVQSTGEVRDIPLAALHASPFQPR